MIIEAKGSQNSSEPVDFAKRYQTTPEKTTRMPVFIGMMITAIAVYLKNILPVRSELPTEHPGLGADTHSTPRGVRAESGSPGLDDITTGSIPDEPPMNGIPLSYFSMPEHVQIRFTSSFDAYGPRMAPFFPAAVTYLPTNDNFVTPAVAASGRPAQSSAPSTSRVASDDGEDEAVAGDDDPPDELELDDEEEEEEEDDEGANRAPLSMGPVKLNDVFAGQVVLIGLTQLLFGTTDPDGDALTINDLTASGGTLARVGDGWSFVTLPGALGLITFVYQIGDGLLEIMQTATLNVVRNSVHLTPGADFFVGTPWDDDIDGLAGDDVIDARAGNDIVVGGLGDDNIVGGDGDDQLFGGDGLDTILGGAGNDIIGGGNGNDRLFGNDGNDVINGDAGDDQLFGDQGDDILDGGDGADSLEGSDGDDTLIGGAGNDAASGGSGTDFIDGGAGDDDIEGGAGDDFINPGGGDDNVNAGDGDDHVMGGSGANLIDGGEGHDTLDYSESEAAVVVDVDAGTAQGEDIDDHFTAVEEVVGSQADDIFIVGAKATVLTGGQGEDLFIFQVTDSAPTLSHDAVHEILDFLVGDRIHVAKYEISHRAERLEEERFGDIYDALEEGFEEGLPIRVTYAIYDDQDHTVIEADIDRNNTYDIAIVLEGVQPGQIMGHQFG